MPATCLEDVFIHFMNQPMTPAEFEALYVNADRGRGGPVFDQLKRRLVRMPEGRQKILLAGHKGCGKSTELLRLQRDIERDFVVLSFSVQSELDPMNIHYIELFIVTMEKLFDLFVREPRIYVEPRYIENVRNWMATEEIEHITHKYLSMDVAAGLKTGVDIPFFAKVFAQFKSAAKASTSLKEALKTKVEPKLSELILNCNLLIGQVKAQLATLGKKGLMIVIEDLDKVEMQKAEDIFYGHAPQLVQLDCHIVFTYPIALLYHPRFKTIENNFEKALVLPMVMVRDKAGDPFEPGIAVMEEVVGHRMDVGLFADPSVLRDMIEISGGCFWDLFRLVKDAADSAMDDGQPRIGPAHFRAAYYALKADYERTLAENREKGIKVDEYYDALVNCAKDPHKKPRFTDPMLDLMNNLSVLNYNGQNWHDVHPIVKDILTERGLI